MTLWKVFEESLQYWKGRYCDKRIEWHIENVNPILLRHLENLLPPNKQDAHILIPLCGKTKDIPFLLSLGHRVFGVEGLTGFVEDLEAENNLGIKYDEEEGLYKTPDGRLKIYCGDFFTCPLEKWGPFDAVWDRASFIAIDYPKRKAYIDVMTKALTTSGHPFRYLFQTVRYDRTIAPGPPRSVDEQDLTEYFNPWANVQELEKTLLSNEHPCMQVLFNGKDAGGAEVHEVVLFLTNKDS